MRIWHDRSYITRDDQEMISLGYAAEDFYSLRLSFVYSEDECARNRKLAMASEDNTRIRAAQMRSDEIESVVEAIAGQCACYQYRSDKEYPFDSNGNPRNYPWFIQVENGKAVKEKTALGGVHMKKGSYQKGQTVFLNINDYDFFRLMQQTSRYIETWELTYGPKLIREAQQIIAAQQRAAADEDLPA